MGKQLIILNIIIYSTVIHVPFFRLQHSQLWGEWGHSNELTIHCVFIEWS